MEQRKYDLATARAICELIAWPESWCLRDDGIYVEDEFRANSPQDEVFDWTPAYDMDWPGAPNPMTAPALPIPFTANELAAFMLDGCGHGIQEVLDRRIGYALDDESLQRFTLHGRWVQDALQDAYALAAKAQIQIGTFDYDEQQKAHALMRQTCDANNEANSREGVFDTGITSDEANRRRKLAIASVADLKARAQQATVTAKEKWFAWRKAMVCQLLQPQQADTQAQAQAQADTEPAPVVPVPVKRGPGWTLKPSLERSPGYRWPLYQILKAAHNAGEPCPKPREVLEIWKLHPQPDIQVMPDGVKYNDGLGNPKEANLRAIRKAIKNLLHS